MISAAARAEALGTRAGKAFVDTGAPSRNPFLDNPKLEDLAATWRRAYFAATARS
ncbi:MAG TPA: hypothetical protein VGL39_27980 [Jatrophihabitantaceae bacterium]|jgi:hypothetical protein